MKRLLHGMVGALVLAGTALAATPPTRRRSNTWPWATRWPPTPHPQHHRPDRMRTLHPQLRARARRRAERRPDRRHLQRRPHQAHDAAAEHQRRRLSTPAPSRPSSTPSARPPPWSPSRSAATTSASSASPKTASTSTPPPPLQGRVRGRSGPEDPRPRPEPERRFGRHPRPLPEGAHRRDRIRPLHQEERLLALPARPADRRQLPPGRRQRDERRHPRPGRRPRRHLHRPRHPVRCHDARQSSSRRWVEGYVPVNPAAPCTRTPAARPPTPTSSATCSERRLRG